MTDGRQLQLTFTLDMPADFEPAEIEEEQAALGRVLAGLEGAVAVGMTPPDAVPGGAKGLPEVLGTLTATIASSRQLLATVLEAVRSWVSDSADRSVLVEIDGSRIAIRNASTEDVRRLIDVFVEQHSRDG
jgi:hypothetical protein